MGQQETDTEADDLDLLLKQMEVIHHSLVFPVPMLIAVSLASPALSHMSKYSVVHAN